MEALCLHEDTSQDTLAKGRFLTLERRGDRRIKAGEAGRNRNQCGDRSLAVFAGCREIDSS